MDDFKKNISDIKMGKLISEHPKHGKTYDYTHILPDKLKNEGYQLSVNHNVNSYHPISSILSHEGKIVGKVSAFTPEKTVIEPHVIKGFGIKSPHRSKGLARNMYEALYSHSGNLGYDTVKGGYHTLAASGIHQSLSNRHGLDYKPELMPSEHIGTDKYSVMPYEYKIKTGLNSSKFDLGVKKHEQLNVELLKSYGLNEEQINKLQIDINNLSKKEIQFDPIFIGYKIVKNAYPDGINAAINVQQAFKQGFVFSINMGGKHSHGSLIAKDMATEESYLLKPGSGKLSPSAGVNDENVSEATRECAFWHVAESWNLGSYIPRSDMLFIDDKEYACIKMLPWEYKSLAEAKVENYDNVIEILKEYTVEGLTYRWAMLDMVLGNTDRHGNNLMIYNKDIKLIDQGSAFAFWNFNPAFDSKSFIPYYLRFLCKNGFMKLTPEDRYKHMPMLEDDVEKSVKEWVMNLSVSDLIACLQRYGINSEAFVYRLNQIKILCNMDRIDRILGRMWCGLL